MRIIPLPTNPEIYSSTAYLLLGDFNDLDSVNAMIDTGGDKTVVASVRDFAATGVGKKPVEKVLITHEHFDHIGGITALKETWGVRVYGFSRRHFVDYSVKDNEVIKVADTFAQIIYTPGHSNDSMCIYFPSERILFSGDTQLVITVAGGSYSRAYLNALKRLSVLPICCLYPGHGKPLFTDIGGKLARSVEVVEKSVIMD